MELLQDKELPGITSLYITYVSAHKDSSSIMQNVEVPKVIVEDPAFKDSPKKSELKEADKKYLYC